MASRNLYLTYKQDISRLLYWVINTSNGIVQSAADAGDCAPVTVNTTGKITISNIFNMSRLIAKHLDPIPTAISKIFQAIVNDTPDPEIERRNATHKHFIDALTEALDALGGNSWEPNKVSAIKKEEQDDQVFRNHFAVLSIAGSKIQDEEASSADEPEQVRAQVHRKKAGKGKKGKRGKKQRQKPSAETISEPSLADVLVETCRIIEDSDGLVSEYLRAVYAVVNEWMELRSFTWDLWREVAYENLNGAIAASLTNTAVAMVKQTCLAVFADFPNHESYETIMQTITRGDPDKAQTKFRLEPETRLDVKEQFWIHVYTDLMDFIIDFQKNQTGKPTKAMQAQLDSWYPKFDLQRATNDERVFWRRAYAINWLYDLANIFSTIVVQRYTMKGERHVYEEVAWSTKGPWHDHRRLFGLNEFAGDITSLAMQKENTDVQRRVVPHHVFQLQCIVDSFAASRGWTLSPLRGHIVVAPPRKFRPRRDVDLFLDREVKKTGRGVLQSIDVLKQFLQKDADLHQDPNRHIAHVELLEEFKLVFIDWLGESNHMYGLTNIPASRFSKYNANGLWEYSPLLCAAGLVEGLVLVQRMLMKMWDRILEPTLILHLHNMLVKKNYLAREVGLWATLEDLLTDWFFPSGVPDTDFATAIVARTSQLRPDRPPAKARQAVIQDKTKDVHHLLDPRFNSFFTTKPALVSHYDAEWVPERIPDDEIKIPSTLYMLRLMQTEREVNVVTNEKRLKQTDLVKCVKAQGKSDAELLQMASISLQGMDTNDEEAEALMRQMSEYKDYKPGPRRDPYRVSENKKQEQTKGRAMLELLRLDIFADVCGNYPMSSLNYIWVIVHMMMLFMDIEDGFCKAHHPLRVEAYENPQPSLRRQKRVALVAGAMAEEDDQAMKLFAESFEKHRTGVLSCIYWEDLREEEFGLKPQVMVTISRWTSAQSCELAHMGVIAQLTTSLCLTSATNYDMSITA